jgi:hypothetical protein
VEVDLRKGGELVGIVESRLEGWARETDEKGKAKRQNSSQSIKKSGSL